MLWSFRDLDLTLGSLSHYARHLHVTLKPAFLDSSFRTLSVSHIRSPYSHVFVKWKKSASRDVR